MLDILLIDDEPSIRLSVGDALREAGHSVTIASDGAEGFSFVTSKVFDVVITDIRLPKVDGLSIFRRVRAESPDTDVILITAYGAVADAVSALKEGAYDYLTKPFDTEEIIIRVARSAEKRALRHELSSARNELEAKKSTESIVGRSPPMVRLLDRIETIAQSDSPVLITGESGTGKELVARSLHNLGPRKNKNFVAVNCAAFPETLLEAELFGHERGAFTGAIKRREGRFKAADGGTLFLDEIAEIPPTAQAKLLRVLQEGVIEPLGTNTAIRVDVRVISATHQNLKERISVKLFREDLYYRLNVLDLAIPPLRERRGDLPLLVEYFLKKRAPNASEFPSISPRAWGALSEYPFPGNVRELEHAIERATVLARGKEIDLEHLPEDIAGRRRIEAAPEIQRDSVRPLSVAMKEFEREYLLRTLSLVEGKKARAADLLGISRKNLWEKLRAHGILDSEIED
ncbi:sigma-54 dependent transcriptional regulator [Myxococcota bacterium]|nr:sigma-54 dependent transcriptional regulator [Myxococcota bacterium]